MTENQAARGRVRLTLSAGLLLAVAACGQTAPPADAWRAETGTSALESGVSGVLQDEAGRPIAGARVLACMSTVCFSDNTGPTGGFSFQIDAPNDVVIKTEESLTTEWRRAAAMAPVRLSEARMVDVGAVHMPTLPEGRPIGPARSDPQTVAAGDGLELTVHRSALTPPLGEVVVEAAARRLPEAFLPRYAALVDEEVIAVYALHPFTATSKVPVGVRAPSNLPEGTRVQFRTISEIDGSLSEPVPGRASGTSVATDPSTGITRLTYLVITR